MSAVSLTPRRVTSRLIEELHLVFLVALVLGVGVSLTLMASAVTGVLLLPLAAFCLVWPGMVAAMWLVAGWQGEERAGLREFSMACLRRWRGICLRAFPLAAACCLLLLAVAAVQRGAGVMAWASLGSCGGVCFVLLAWTSVGEVARTAGRRAGVRACLMSIPTLLGALALCAAWSAVSLRWLPALLLWTPMLYSGSFVLGVIHSQRARSAVLGEV